MVEELPAGRGAGGRDQGVGHKLMLGREGWEVGPPRMSQSHQEHARVLKGHGEPLKGFKQGADVINFDSYPTQQFRSRIHV